MGVKRINKSWVERTAIPAVSAVGMVDGRLVLRSSKSEVGWSMVDGRWSIVDLSYRGPRTPHPYPCTERAPPAGGRCSVSRLFLFRLPPFLDRPGPLPITPCLSKNQRQGHGAAAHQDCHSAPTDVNTYRGFAGKCAKKLKIVLFRVVDRAAGAVVDIRISHERDFPNCPGWVSLQ